MAAPGPTSSLLSVNTSYQDYQNKLNENNQKDVKNEYSKNTNSSSESQKSTNLPYSEQAVSQENGSIREIFELGGKTFFADHVKKTRGLINFGASGLNGRLIVFGPGLIEPLEELSKKFEEVVLVDYDKKSLELASKRLSCKKVICHKFDLNGELYKNLDALFEKTIVEKSDFSVFHTRLESILNNFKVKDSNISKILGKADYVISSLVASQLILLVRELFDNFIKFQFDLQLDTFESQKFYHNFAPISHMRHLNDLMDTLKPGGKIYFADTITHKYLIPYVGEDRRFIYIEKKFLDEIRKNHEVVKENNWHWLSIPETGLGWEVQGFVLKKKTLTESAKQ